MSWPPRRPPRLGPELDADLAKALATLRRGGLEPEVRSIRPNRPTRRRPPVRFDWAAAIAASDSHRPRRPTP